jgi:peptide/nickel transport system substrate-binding protein
VAAVEIVDPLRVRFRLKQPWPDFLTFYSSTTGAGLYKFVSFTPGVELVLEAFDQYWRKIPSVKRLVFRVISDESTRLAALKRGEVDMRRKNYRAAGKALYALHEVAMRAYPIKAPRRP